MEESYLGGLLVSLLFAFVLFKKDKTATDEVAVEHRVSTSYREVSNATGVAKYLKNQQDIVNQSQVTGVTKYLQEKEVLLTEQAETSSSSVSGVARYLANKDVAVSGVSKYMARQSVQAKQRAKENVSGVEKYLINRG